MWWFALAGVCSFASNRRMSSAWGQFVYRPLELPPHPFFVGAVPFGGGHRMHDVSGGQGATRVISAHVRAEGAVHALIVVLAHRVPITGIGRGGAAVGQRVADLSGLVVGHLPDVLAFGVG